MRQLRAAWASVRRGAGEHYKNNARLSASSSIPARALARPDTFVDRSSSVTSQGGKVMFDPKRFVLALSFACVVPCCAASPVPPNTTPEAPKALPGKLSSEALVASWRREHAEQEARLAEVARARDEERAQAEAARKVQLEAEEQRSAQLELEAQRERELAERTRRSESDQKSRQQRVNEPDSDDSSPARTCCKICRTGCACGNTCISCSKTCHRAGGCACDG